MTWSDIWTQCADKFEFIAISERVHRVVDMPSRYTMQLVDNVVEHDLLEELLDDDKPRSARTPHFLLSGAFRYPPLRYGSRFGKASERAILYASLSLPVCFAERSHYFFAAFVADTAADISGFVRPMVSFQFDVTATHGVDLTAPPFAAFAKQISARDSHIIGQGIGSALRTAGCEVLLSASARADGTNAALFVPSAADNVGDERAWDVHVRADQLVWVSADQKDRYMFAAPA